GAKPQVDAEDDSGDYCGSGCKPPVPRATAPPLEPDPGVVEVFVGLGRDDRGHAPRPGRPLRGSNPWSAGGLGLYAPHRGIGRPVVAPGDSRVLPSVPKGLRVEQLVALR